MGVTRPGRFPGVARLAAAVNPEFLGNTGKDPLPSAERGFCWVRDIEPLRFGIMARPRSADRLGDEILGWKTVGVARVMSVLEPSEVGKLGLEAEASLREAMVSNSWSFQSPTAARQIIRQRA